MSISLPNIVQPSKKKKKPVFQRLNTTIPTLIRTEQISIVTYFLSESEPLAAIIYVKHHKQDQMGSQPAMALRYKHSVSETWKGVVGFQNHYSICAFIAFHNLHLFDPSIIKGGGIGVVVFRFWSFSNCGIRTSRESYVLDFILIIAVVLTKSLRRF